MRSPRSSATTRSSPHGNLSELAVRAKEGTLGFGQVRHVLIHGLAAGRPGELAAAQELVDAHVSNRPLSEVFPLAVEIITAAYAGFDSADAKPARRARSAAA